MSTDRYGEQAWMKGRRWMNKLDNSCAVDHKFKRI